MSSLDAPRHDSCRGGSRTKVPVWLVGIGGQRSGTTHFTLGGRFSLVGGGIDELCFICKEVGKGRTCLRSGSFVVVGTGRWWACDDIAYLPTLYKMYAEMDSNLNLHVPPYLASWNCGRRW